MEIFNPVEGAPVPAGHIRLRSAEGSIQFQGKIVASSSSDNGFIPNKLKWTELELYRKTDGTDHYVLHVIARSVAYHAMSGCGNGVPVALSDLATRYLDPRCPEPIPEPCEVCKPRDIEAHDIGNIMVMAEVDWHIIHVCETVDDLFKNLRQTKGPNTGQFGQPALILLTRAQLVDNAIALALNTVRSI